MGKNKDFASRAREPPAEISVGGTNEEQRLPQGPIDMEAHLSSLAQTESTDINLSKALHLVSRNNANAETNEVLLNVSAGDSSCSNCDGNSVANPNDSSEEGRGHLGWHDTGNTPLSIDSHVQKNPKFPAEGPKTAQLKRDVIAERDSMEGRLNTNSQETLKLNEDLRTLFQQWDNKFHEQEGLFVRQDNEIAILKREHQQIQEVISKLHSRDGQVVELHDMICQVKTAVGKLRQEINSQPSIKDELLDREIGKTFGHLFRDNRALHANLLKCQTQLESANHSRISEAEQMLALEEVNRKLEQKVENIQRQLCKERTGQNGAYVDGQQTPSLLESTAKEMFISVTAFSALLSKYTGPNGDNPVHSFIVGSDLWKSSRVARKHHWTYILKKFISDHFFFNFEYEKFVRHDNSVLFLDPEERVRTCFEYFKSCKNEGAMDRAFYHTSNDELDYLFFVYLAKILPSLLPQDIQSILCTTFPDRNEFTRARLNDLLSRLAVHQQKLVRSLIQAAEKVWQFHKLCLSFDPPATIFRVPSEKTFNQQYMESTDSLPNDDRNSVPTVAFSVYPGFRLRKSIIKCEVYVAIKT